MSTLKVDTLKNTSGVEVYTAKAWVNFNGKFATSPFTEANGGINAAGNVSSVTDNGTGAYTVNFTTAFADANYVVVLTNEETGTEMHNAQTNTGYDQTTSAAKIRCCISGTGTNYDPDQVHCIFFR